MASDTEITKVRIVIRHLLWQIREIRNDRDAAWKWVNRFANTLQYQELEQDPDQYALAILAEARSFNDQQRRKGQMLGVRKQMAKEGVTNPTQEQLDEKWLEMYGNDFTQDAPHGNAGVDMTDAGNGAALKSPTSCDTFTADGDIRGDSQAKPDGSAITRNETRHLDALEPSANHYATRQAKNGDAATSDGAEAFVRRESGIDAPTTVSNNMRQSAKTRDNSEHSRCRYAPPSCSPEDGNHYDQDPSISTDNTQPEGLTGPSHGGSVASLEARESQARQSQRRAVANAQKCGRTSQSHSATARPRASFRNKEEFIQWAIDDGLDPVDANECWEATEERGGKDADGNTVKNMKAFARQWCRTRANNRRTA